MIPTADVLCLVLGVLGLSVGVLRTIRHARFVAAHLTVLVYALGLALLVRSPWLGDTVLDDAMERLTGMYNIPDLLGHLLTFVAIGAALGFFAHALGYRTRMWRTYAVIGVLMLVLVALFVDSPAGDVQTQNIVQLGGMRAYSAVFSLALVVTHTFGLFIARHGRLAVGWTPEIVALYVGTLGGIAMAVHRLLAVGFPEVYDWNYSMITWVFSLACIGGYIGAAWIISTVQSRTAARAQCNAIAVDSETEAPADSSAGRAV